MDFYAYRDSYVYTKDGYVYTEDRSAYPPLYPPLFPSLLRFAISTPWIAMSTPRSPRLHRRLIKMFWFVFSRFGQRPSYADLGPVLLPEPPALVAVVALRPLATTRSWLGE